MRNVDKIKALEKELGKYQKKVTDQNKLLRQLHKELEQAHAGTIQLQNATDGLFTAVALEYGETVKDEETGEEIGKRLTLPVFDIRELREKYRIRARRDAETETYVLGIVPREAAKK